MIEPASSVKPGAGDQKSLPVPRPQQKQPQQPDQELSVHPANLFIMVRPNMHRIVLYVVSTIGVHLTKEAEASFKEHAFFDGPGFEFTSADIAEIAPRVKHMTIVDQTRGRCV